MQIKIQITKGYIIALVLMIIGVGYFGVGINTLYNLSHAINLENVRIQDLSSSKFVKGYITSYIGKDIITLGEDGYSGQCQVLITIGTEYIYYTIPVEADKYIQIMVSNKSTITKLEKFIHGEGKGIFFEGEIIKAPIEINYDWYKGIKEFETDKIISGYVIKEVSFDDKSKIIYPGISLIISSILCFFVSGGTKKLLIKENKYVIENKFGYANSYNKLNELEIQKSRLKNLSKRLVLLKRSFIYKVPLLILGTYILFKCYFWEFKFVGIVIIIISLKGIWLVFINSGFLLANKIVKTFEIKTIYLQIKECNNSIELLQQLMKNEK